jgi:hypothetical protein
LTRARDNASNVAGDISGVTAGTGLTGGGSSGALTLSLDTPVSATNGGTAQSTFTTGDILYASAANTLAKLSIGTTSQTLVVSGGIPSWATPSSGGMTLISETVASALSSLSFTSLGSHKQLLLCWSGITHLASATAFSIRLNNDSGSNYIGQNLWYGGGFDVAIFTNTQLNNAGMAAFGVNCTGGGSSAANGWLIIDNYTSTSKVKTYNLFNLFKQASDTAGVARGGFTIGYYNSTSAISSIDIVRTAGSATFSNETNTTIRLYGVA